VFEPGWLEFWNTMDWLPAGEDWPAGGYGFPAELYGRPPCAKPLWLLPSGLRTAELDAGSIDPPSETAFQLPSSMFA